MEKGGFDHVLWGGNFNYDPVRNTNFTQTGRMFLQCCGISTVWDKFPIDFTHTHTDYESTSVIDHFLCNEGLLPYVSDAGALHLGDNLSRHSPIMLRLNVGQIANKVPAEPVPRPKRPACYKATKQQISDYTVLLSDKLDQL